VALRPVHRWVHTGQIVTAQVAVVVVVATSGHPAGALTAVATLAIGWGRWRRRPLHQWCRVAAGLVARRLRERLRRLLPAQPSTPAGLAPAGLAPAGLAPAGLAPAGRYGEVAVLRVGAAAGGVSAPMVLRAGYDRPGDRAEPGIAVQALLTGCTGPAGDGPAAVSYRQLTGGGALTTRELLLAVRVPTGDSVDRVVRRFARRLSPLPVTLLSGATLADTLAALGDDSHVHEQWSSVQTRGMTHVTYHIAGDSGDTLPRLLALPAVVTTVSPGRGGAFVRVTTRGGAAAQLADRALRAAAAPPASHPGDRPGRLPGPVRERVRRLDGEHLAGLAATLPTAVPAAAPAPPPTPPAGTPPDRELRLEPAGVLLGRHRHGAPALVELFGPVPVQVVLVGDDALARLLVWRALGAGARVRVRTDRPHVWHPLAGAAAGAPLSIAPAGSHHAPADVAGTPYQPVLDVIDPPGGTGPDQPDRGWHAQVLVCPRVTAERVGLLSRSPTVLARRLDEPEATLVSAAMGLGRAGTALRHTATGAVTVLCHGTAAEVLLSPTASESSLVGSVAV
jgi:hypothetical protein